MQGKRQKAKGKNQKSKAGVLNFCLLAFAFCLLIFLPACKSRALLDQAQQAWDSGDYEGATARYEEFLKNNPQHERAADIHFTVANIYFLNLKQYDRAAAHYIHLIEDFPKSPLLYKARMRLAECYPAQNKRREAINEYENIIKFFPDTPDKRSIRLSIADLYADHDVSQALVEYQKVVKDAPYDGLSERAYLRIGGICTLRDEFNDAIPAFQIVDQNTRDAAIKRQARFGLADCYERIFDFEAAIKVLEQTATDPKNPGYIQKRIEGIRERQRQRKLIQPEEFGLPKR